MNFILFAIVSGGIYFKEFSYFEPINVVGFVAVGTLNACCQPAGVLLVHSAHAIGFFRLWFIKASLLHTSRATSGHLGAHLPLSSLLLPRVLGYSCSEYFC